MTDSTPAQKTLVEIKPRMYLNGMPKVGLHRVLLLAACYCSPAIDGKAWAGSFKGNAFTTEWYPDKLFFNKLAGLTPGTYLRGHMGYREDIERFLWHLGAGVVFVYRDLRDVLVSQTYHSRSVDRETWSHPEKELFAGMTFEEAMIANLVGIQGDEFKYVSLRDRWEQYAPWMDVEWALKVRFEYTLEHPLEFAADFVGYMYGRFASAYGDTFEATREALMGEAEVVAPAMDDDGKLILTYRKGTAGQWRDEFTPYVKRLFKAQMGDWLVRLGYEDDDQW